MGNVKTQFNKAFTLKFWQNTCRKKTQDIFYLPIPWPPISSFCTSFNIFLWVFDKNDFVNYSAYVGEKSMGANAFTQEWVDNPLGLIHVCYPFLLIFWIVASSFLCFYIIVCFWIILFVFLDIYREQFLSKPTQWLIIYCYRVRHISRIFFHRKRSSLAFSKLGFEAFEGCSYH